MGEVPRKERGTDTMRVLDIGAGDEEQILLERLRRVWPSIGKDKNKLIIEVPKKKPYESRKILTRRVRTRTNPRAVSARKTPPASGAARPVPSASNTSGKLGEASTMSAQDNSDRARMPIIQLADFKQVLSTPSRPAAGVPIRLIADAAPDRGKSGCRPPITRRIRSTRAGCAAA